MRLAQLPRRRGLSVELWPAFDAYDLRIEFADGRVWAVDVKDWTNPIRLARLVDRIPNAPSWDRGYFVFPRERIQRQRDYVRLFEANCDVLGGNPPLYRSGRVRFPDRGNPRGGRSQLMRDRSHWYQSIRRRLRAALRSVGADNAAPTLMCKVELGLTLLELVAPTASALALWPLLTGYSFAGNDMAGRRSVGIARYLIGEFRSEYEWRLAP